MRPLSEIAPGIVHGNGIIDVRSFMVGHCYAYLHRRPPEKSNDELSRSFRELSAAMLKYWVRALWAYDCMAKNIGDFGDTAWCFLTQSSSLLDAFALLCRAYRDEIPQPEDEWHPGIVKVAREISDLDSFLKSDWVDSLIKQRNKMVHRGYLPQQTDDGEAILVRSTWKLSGSGKTRFPPNKIEEKLDLERFATGLSKDFPAFDRRIAEALRRAKYGFRDSVSMTFNPPRKYYFGCDLDAIGLEMEPE